MLHLLPLTGAANIAIGADAATNGVIYGLHFLLSAGYLYLLGVGLLWAFLIALVVTGIYALWRSQSPREADLDLVWENPDKDNPDLGRKTTYKEVLNSLRIHGIPLVVITFASTYYSLWSLFLLPLVVVPSIAHIAAWNKSKLGKFLYKHNSGYPRRFGELVTGIFVHGIALAVLTKALIYYTTLL